MQPDYAIHSMIAKRSALPPKRLRVVQTFEDLRLGDIRRGIIFVFAAWSGPAMVAFERFTSVMKTIDTGSLDLVVLDTDCLTPDSIIKLFGTDFFTSGGWGEVVWVRDGVVVAREIGGDGSESLLEQHTRQLIEDARGPENAAFDVP